MPADKLPGGPAPRATIPLAEIRLPTVNAYWAPSVDQTASRVSAARCAGGEGAAPLPEAAGGAQRPPDSRPLFLGDLEAKHSRALAAVVGFFFR